ncbi:MAG: trans-sulfuration enzyme family protein [Thermoanaerobaculia bacterium]
MHEHPQYGTPDLLDRLEGAIAVPVVRSTTFAYRDAESLRAVMAGEVAGEVYPRYGHVPGRAFEARMAALEGADGAVAFASGMAALTALFLGLTDGGDAVAVSRQVYGGLDSMLTHDLPRLGLEVRRFDPFAAGELDEALADGRVRVVHVETPTNPLCRVVDLAAVAAKAHAAGALLTVDATFQPPPLQRPLAHGADLVMHSATKILGGHSDTLGGVVSGRHELLERLYGFRRRTGATLAPDTAWLLHRSLATLEVRARRAAETAASLAAYLDGVRTAGGPVETVHYPGLPEHPDHAAAGRQMQTFGFMLSFEARGGLAGAVAIYDRLRRVKRAVSLGGIESVASLPLHTSHSYLSPEERAAAGVGDGLIRLSVGLEPAAELEDDLAQALQVVD